MFIFQPKANFLEIMKKVNLSFVVELLYNAIKFIAHTCFSIFNVLLKLIVTDEFGNFTGFVYNQSAHLHFERFLKSMRNLFLLFITI